MRVCYFGTYRADYARNRVMIEGLRRAGVQVVECHVPFWPAPEARVRLAIWGWMTLGFWLRLARAWRQLARQWKTVGPVDVMIVGYPGQVDVFLAARLARKAGIPLVWDVFMSLWLLARERGLHRRNPLATAMMRAFEWLGLRRPQLLLLDTPQHADWLAHAYGLPPERIALVPTGADDSVFRPRPAPRRRDASLRVLYYGSFIPNHGVMHVVEAARLLSNEPDIRFEMIGEGPDKQAAVVRARGLTTVSFADWASPSELAERIAASDVCLGAFGHTPMSQLTIHNKVFEALASAKAVVTGDTPAAREVFRHKEHVYLCAPGNPAALAAALRELRSDRRLRETIAMRGHALYESSYSQTHLGQAAAAALLQVTARDA